MLTIKRRGKEATREALATAIQALNQSEGVLVEVSLKWLVTQLEHLQRSSERFGEVDLDNLQQVALVMRRIARGVEAPPSRPSVSESTEPYALALIGSGSTAAYYLDTLGPAHDFSTTVVIGPRFSNPWIKERGQGISFINHTQRQIAMPSANVSAYGGNESFVNRTEFGLAADTLIRDSGCRWLTCAARRIEKHDDLYVITCGDGSKVKARKVIFAAGAGGLRTPPEVKDPSVKNRSRIVDMSTFIRDIVEGIPGRVVVWGSNAAIDAVAAAKIHGWEIAAWIYSSAPAWLPGTRYRSAPYELHKVPQVKYTGRTAIKIADDGKRLKVLNVNKTEASQVDYVVYGLGSEDLLKHKNEKGELLTHGMMDVTVLEGEDNLSPLLDTESVFLDRGTASAFLGWRNKSGTFQVFGLAAENHERMTEDAKSTPQRRIFNARRIDMNDPRVAALKCWLSGDVLTVGQLTYIRSAIRAANHYIPGSIEHRVDYSHADANALRVHLATKYPGLPECYASWFIKMIARTRGGLQSRLPHGFTEAQVQWLEGSLAQKEASILNQGPNTELDAVNWQWTLGTDLRNLVPPEGEEVREGLSKITRSKEHTKFALITAAKTIRDQTGGTITQVRTRKGKTEITLSLTPNHRNRS
ncbi:NAD(P)/FAD-dependent oxidoreductase [Melittangium boletus]|uniref:NAD(P)/FAD-dependent oxidoreductase n=1 Tax=Melittangium boletus TaxID=83453 RepID=UPI003DA621D1